MTSDDFAFFDCLEFSGRNFGLRIRYSEEGGCYVPYCDILEGENLRGSFRCNSTGEHWTSFDEEGLSDRAIGYLERIKGSLPNGSVNWKEFY